MKKFIATFTKEDSKSHTSNKRLYIEKEQKRLEDIEKDPQKKARHMRNECQYCAYTGYMSGQGFTSYTCGICGVEEIWHNTRTPKLCQKCAEENELCSMCGSDIDLRENRRKYNW